MITLIVVVAVWQVLASWRARMSVAREEAYRRLAEETVASQTRLSEQQARLTENLDAIKERLTGIETILREVG